MYRSDVLRVFISEAISLGSGSNSQEPTVSRVFPSVVVTDLTFICTHVRTRILLPQPVVMLRL